jgi:type VI protein secretion system component VasF
MPEAESAADHEGVTKRSEHQLHAVQKLEELEHTADVGESDKTPLILIGEVWIFAAIAVLVVLAVSLIAYRLAS